MEDRGGGDVDALGDLGVLVAEQLHAEEPPGSPVAGDADGEAVVIGVAAFVTGLVAAASWSRRPVVSSRVR